MIKIKFNKEMVKFIVVFAASLAVLYFVSIQFESYIPIFNMRSTAQVLYFSLKAIGINATLENYQIIFSNFSVDIIRQCTGIFEVIAIISCIVAFPAAVKKKIIGVSLAIPLIYFFNMARLIFLSLLGIYSSSMFEIAHEYLLQLTFLAVVVFYWLFWIDKVVKKNVPSIEA